LYLYYLLTLVLPTVIFTIGAAFLVFSITRNAAFGIVFLFACFCGTLNLEGESWQGLLNFSGINLPNEYSEITGFSGRETYLLHRLGWTLLGVGLVIASTLFSGRLPQRQTEKRDTRCLAAGSILAGLLCLLTIGGVYHKKYERRAQLARIYNTHADHAKLYLDSMELNILLKDETLEGKTRMLLRNETGKALEEFILYLNPRLNVSTLKTRGKISSFHREEQVIVVEEKVGIGETLDLELNYAGGIEEHVFYLDVPEKKIREAWSWKTNLCYKGKTYYYLEKEQVVLFPEALWYPTSVPPVNPASPYALETNFTQYTLHVVDTRKRTIISQGERVEKENHLTFRGKTPLAGLSLVAGNYEKRSLQIDSIDFDFYFYPGHSQLIEAYLEIHSSKYRNKIFQSLGIDSLPFRHLSYAETPRLLTSYSRVQRGGSELVQPGLICFPERSYDQCHDRQQIRKSRMKTPTAAINAIRLININISTGVPYDYIRLPKLRQWLSLATFHPTTITQKEPHPLYCASLVNNHLQVVSAKEFPGIDLLLFSAIQKPKSPYSSSQATLPPKEVEGRHFLEKHSLKETFQNPNLETEFAQTLIKMKAEELYTLFSQHGVVDYRVHAFLKTFLDERHFQTIKFEELQTAARQHLNVDIREILETLYHRKGELPAFIVQEKMELLTQKQEKGENTSPAQITFAVYNPSNTDGVMQLYYAPSKVSKNQTFPRSSYTYLIPAKEGRKIVQYIPDYYAGVLLYFGISQNNPYILEFKPIKAKQVAQLDTTSRKERMNKEQFFASNEIIVDNQDAGFSLEHGDRKILQRWFNKPTGLVEGHNFDNSSNRWQIDLTLKSFGYVVRDQVGRWASNKGAKAHWETTLPQAGNYEVFIYLSANSARSAGSWARVKDPTLRTIQQHYTIEHGNETTNISSTHRLAENPIYTPPEEEYGWISLGKFYFPEGKTKVTLHDKGVEKQIIWADAVKWVKVE